MICPQQPLCAQRLNSSSTATLCCIDGAPDSPCKASASGSVHVLTLPLSLRQRAPHTPQIVTPPLKPRSLASRFASCIGYIASSVASSIARSCIDMCLLWPPVKVLKTCVVGSDGRTSTSSQQLSSQISQQVTWQENWLL